MILIKLYTMDLLVVLILYNQSKHAYSSYIFFLINKTREFICVYKINI